MLIIIKC